MANDENPQPGFQGQANDIKVRLIENAILVSAHGRWFGFPDWPTASRHVEARLEALKKARAQAAPTMDGGGRP